MRRLGSTEHIARCEHFCDTCCEYIMPGDSYCRTVFLNEDKENHRISIRKEHINPSCEYPTEPDYDSDSEGHDFFDKSLPLAA